MTNHTPANYQNLINTISAAFQQDQQKTYQAINTGLLETYWEIGKHIVEFEQQGKGFSLSNLKRFRQFYLLYRKGATVSHKLTWSHFGANKQQNNPNLKCV